MPSPNCLLTSSLIAKSSSSPLSLSFLSFFFFKIFIYLFGCTRALELLLSCPTACGILVLHTGTEPMSPALQSRFLTTEPPGKSLLFFLVSFFEHEVLTSYNENAFSFGFCVVLHILLLVSLFWSGGLNISSF